MLWTCRISTADPSRSTSDLGFLVHADHRRILRWVQVQAHDVADLGFQFGVGGELERLDPVRGDAPLAPDPGHRRKREPGHRESRRVKKSGSQRLTLPTLCSARQILSRQHCGLVNSAWRKISIPSARVLHRSCTRVSCDAVIRAKARRGHQWHGWAAASRRVPPEEQIRANVTPHFE